MKSFTLLFICFLISNIVFSQEDKGEYYDDYWSFGSKDVADYNSTENQIETVKFKWDITRYPVASAAEEKGNYINGRKDSIWRGFFNDGSPYFTEWYKKGKLNKGISYDESGKKYFYKTELINAQPQNGWNDFIRYAQNYWNKVSEYIEEKYPDNFKLLKNKEIEVSFQILIDKKGIATIGEIVNASKYGFNKSAAQKMLSDYKYNWIPAVFKGQDYSSKVIYTVYLKF